MVGMPGMRYFTLTGEGAGLCSFRMFYARPWEFSFDNEAGSSYVRKIEIPVDVIAP